jgi:hypothetical protein
LTLGSDLQQMGSGVQASQEISQNYSTILSCLLEFQGIEQALCMQDETDKQNMQLMA